MKKLKELPLSNCVGAGALAALAFRLSTGVNNPIVASLMFAAGAYVALESKE